MTNKKEHITFLSYVLTAFYFNLKICAKLKLKLLVGT